MFRPPPRLAYRRGICASGPIASCPAGPQACWTAPDPAARRSFPPQVAVHLVKIACEMPDQLGRSLCQWDCPELARQLVGDGTVESISPQTVWRILSHHKLKPWRSHMWLSPKTPRDAEFYRRVNEVIDLYTRPLLPGEVILCVDEKTSLQPRPRSIPTKPALPGGQPVLLEHEYKRDGAINLFAAFDTRSGQVHARTAQRKRQIEFIAFLEQLDRDIPASVTTIHLVMDNLKVHSGKQVQAWLAKHPRFVFHFTPVHGSWMNQVEQWFSILQRKRLRIVNFTNKDELVQRILAFVAQWNECAHPFNWSTKSVAKVMAQAEDRIAA